MTKPLISLAATAGLLLWPNPTAGAMTGPQENDFKIRICHVPPGNPENAHYIWVAPAAAFGHWVHGDWGDEACEEEPSNT